MENQICAGCEAGAILADFVATTHLEVTAVLTNDVMERADMIDEYVRTKSLEVSDSTADYLQAIGTTAREGFSRIVNSTPDRAVICNGKLRWRR